MIAFAKPQLNMWAEPVPVQRGDIWQLGKHRLMCGDSTNAEDVVRLMYGELAQAVITDPPYGTIDATWDSVTLGFIAPLSQLLACNATIAIFCSLPFGFDLHTAMQQSGYQWRWDALWVKHNGGPLVSKFVPRFAHEHIFAYARKDAAISSLVFQGYEAGEQGEAWQRRTSAAKRVSEVYSQSFLPGKVGELSGKRWIRTILNGREKTVMPYRERTPHPTQKPLEVVDKLVLLLSNEKDIIYDPFLGSGTTLIASELTGRTCYGMDLSPTYCADIIQRWQETTGQKAVPL